MLSEVLHTTITNQLNTGVLVLDLEFKVVMWNRFLQVHSNKAPDEVIGQRVTDVFPELPQRWFERKLKSVTLLKTPTFCSWEQRHHLFELQHTRPITTNSKFMAQNCSFLPIEENGELSHICILIEDVTDVCHYQTMLQNTLGELAQMSRIDGLTQIYNRKHWEECLAQEFSKAKRYKHKLSLIMFDLDHFKRLNDTYGHQCGDMVLIETCKIIKKLLRLGDILGRYGGEEFAIILPETDLLGAADVAERIREAIASAKLTYQKHDIKTSVSVGVAELNESDEYYEDIISHADIALYQAKENGRNIVSLAKEPVTKESTA